jgi:transketolase
MGLEPLRAKWKSFGWRVRSVNGNDLHELIETFEVAEHGDGKPTVVIARTLMDMVLKAFRTITVGMVRHPPI